MGTGREAFKSKFEQRTRDNAHNTRGDLILTANRARLALFHAYTKSVRVQGCIAGAHGSDRRKYAGLPAELGIIHGVVPACWVVKEVLFGKC